MRMKVLCAIAMLWAVMLSAPFIGTSVASAQSVFYVRAGAGGTGDGSDWTNAYPAVPATLVRGATYYVATGNYGSVTFNTPVSGTTPITLRKATLADHGTNVGWQSSYGIGQAVFARWAITTSYWTFDGAIGGFDNSTFASFETGHGFKVERAPDNQSLVRVVTPNVRNLTFRRIEFTFNAPTGPPYDTAIYMPQTPSNITFHRVWIHDVPGDVFQIRQMNNFTFEWSKIARNWSDATRHGDVFESDGAGGGYVIRHNIFQDTVGTYHGGHHGAGLLNGVEVYGNVFDRPKGFNGLVATLTGGSGPLQNLRFYNNTIVNGGNVPGNLNLGIRLYIAGSSGEAYNNLWYNSAPASVAFTNVTHDYNWFYLSGSQSEPNIQHGSGDPFVDLANGNYALVAGTAQGQPLPAPYNVDMFGNVRGADGTWDRGAVESGGTGGAPPNPPTNLRIQ